MRSAAGAADPRESNVVLVGLVVVRATLDERVLRRELAGYDVYARRVRYRLIPYIR